MAGTKKVTIEIPAGVDEKLFIRLVTREATRLAKLIEEWEKQMTDRAPTPEELALLMEIKKAVARAAEEG